MKKKRAAGILLPITSLPTRYGIGTMGKEAYDFADFLKKAGQTYWQILPVGPTSYGDSPYQSFSTFAGNPYLIDLETLIEEGLLTQKDCDKAGLEPYRDKSVADAAGLKRKTEDTGNGKTAKAAKTKAAAKAAGKSETKKENSSGKKTYPATGIGANDPMYVDYALQYTHRYPLLKLAYANFLKQKKEQEKAYKDYLKKQAEWLPDYALFMALKDENGGIPFTQWEMPIRLRKRKALADAKKRLAKEVGFYEFLQYKFSEQWTRLKYYINGIGLRIIGDIPIYVAADSADVWANPHLFQLDDQCIPKAVAGVPPDYFSATGQLWGNPLYDWPAHEETGFSWWISRMRHCYELYDMVRIDHFRGFDEYYAVPYGHKTAEFGKWEPGPGLRLFDAIKRQLGPREVIAEDLGFMTKTVQRMVKKSGFPNMKIVLFGFSPEGDSEYLLHNHERNCVVYTGTHDNDTAVGYYKRASRKEKAFARDYLGIKNGREFAKSAIRSALSSVADTAVIPMQDYLELGNEARLNMPATLGGINWQWRLLPGQYSDALADRIRRMCFVYARCDDGKLADGPA
ncbi:MAG: 4-alpha-glucanotransferase [Lachnospiraceae bacterium]|nr:4-alpha-glucanotransferase [Lachnospiraceae bacterium]